MDDIKILFENDDFVAIAKPAGLVMHHDDHHTSGTLVDWLLEKFPNIKNVGEDPSRPGIVHRLDKDTSGVVLVAKTNDAFLYCKDLLKKREVKKTYLALVVGIIKDERGMIDAPIARSTKNFQKRVVGGKQGRSRDAVTEYEVVERLDGYTLVKAFPKTGRTHQIRSHMAHVGYPIACDALYGGKLYQCPAGLGRQFLHAYSLEFQAPSGDGLHIECELAADLKAALEVLHGAK